MPPRTGAARAALSEVWAKGGEGGEAVAQEILADARREEGQRSSRSTTSALPIKEKIEHHRAEIYGADGVDYAAAADKSIAQLEAMGLGKTPVCMAKTQYSFTDDPTKLGRPNGLPDHHPRRLSLGRRRVRRRAGRRHHDHARACARAGRRGDPGAPRRHHRGTLLMSIGFVATPDAPKRDRSLQPGHPRQRLSLHRRPGRASIPPPASWWTAASPSRPSGCSRTSAPSSPPRARDSSQRGQDHRLPGGHGGLRRDERGLCPGLRRAPAGPQHRGRRGAAARRPGGDRRRGGAALSREMNGSSWSRINRRGRIGPGGLAGLQNRDGGASGGSGGFDSHTLPPPRRRLLRSPPLVVLAAGAAARRTGQRRRRAPASRPPASNSPPIRQRHHSPMNAFIASFLIPGWGQAKLNRKLTGGNVRRVGRRHARHESQDPARARATCGAPASSGRTTSAGSTKTGSCSLAFNHLFAGLEAYVSAHLSDFPEDLKLQAVPGGVGASVLVPIRIR